MEEKKSMKLSQNVKGNETNFKSGAAETFHSLACWLIDWLIVDDVSKQQVPRF